MKAFLTWPKLLTVTGAFVVLLIMFLVFKSRDKSDRVPAQFSQSELQYAEVLWGDEDSSPAEGPSVAPNYRDPLKETGEKPFSYSNPLQDELEQQIQQDYHNALYEAWQKRKQKEK